MQGFFLYKCIYGADAEREVPTCLIASRLSTKFLSENVEKTNFATISSAKFLQKWVGQLGGTHGRSDYILESDSPHSQYCIRKILLKNNFIWSFAWNAETLYSSLRRGLYRFSGSNSFHCDGPIVIRSILGGKNGCVRRYQCNLQESESVNEVKIFKILAKKCSIELSLLLTIVWNFWEISTNEAWSVL